MISNKNIFDLRSRQEIYQFISNNPGLKVSEIRQKLNMPRSTIRYHLFYLMKNNLISNKDIRKNKRFYVSEIVGKKDKELINILRQEIPFKIIMYLFFPGFCSEVELAKELKVYPSTIHFHIKKLLEIGIIKPAERKDGGLISFLRNKQIVIKKQVGREIFYTWKNNYIKNDAYRLLVTHKSSLKYPYIIDEYNEFCIEWSKIFEPNKIKKYYIFSSYIDNIIKMLEEIFHFPYHF